MSSTRHASPGIPFRQERHASAEAYRANLNALLVAKRCAVLRHDTELQELVWLIQEQSLTDPFNVGNRAGSIDQVADDLLAVAGYKPARVLIEDFDSGELVLGSPADAERDTANMRAELVRALAELALNPAPPPSAMPGLGREWRNVLRTYRDNLKSKVKQEIAATSVVKSILDALRFTRETGMPSLSQGVAKRGKSAAAKAFCAGSGGLARYVLTPEDDHMGSFYRSIAKALGAAESLSKKDNEVRELVEKTLQASRLMLVFDEAHNLFCGCSRLRREPGRILWMRRLIDGGVPVAFVALPDFEKRIGRYINQLEWDAAQIIDLIARRVDLEQLTPNDFALLVGKIAADLPESGRAIVSHAARSQGSAQYVVDVVRASRLNANKAGRTIPNDDDVRDSVGARPQFQFTPAARPPSPARPRPLATAQPTPLPTRSSPPLVSAPARNTPVVVPAMTV